jgi:predicted Zn finger-like uncharacterized protein
MSLITRCPACGTMFKVVPDQLKVSEGWVRCGHCAEIFDASSHMMQPGDAQAAPVPPEVHAPVPQYAEVQAEPAQVAPTEPAALRPREDDLPSEIESEVPASVLNAEPAPEERRGADSLVESPLDQPFVFRPADARAALESQPAGTRAEYDPFESMPPMVPTMRDDQRVLDDSSLFPESAAPAVEDVSFMRQARRKAFWRRPMVRAFLFLLLLALGALLALQFAVLERDRLAVAQPALRPWLEMVCEPLHCTIQPPRQIDAIAIDSSGFSKLRSDNYRLSFTVKNNAPNEVALPALELTLTDSQDQPLLRRVLTPRELGASGPTVAAGGEWSGSVALAVNANGSGGRVAGYRLLAFYP